MPRAITADPDQVSAIRAPVLLDDQPVALLAMSWARRMPEPERGELGVVQRFAEHAAVALSQAQRAQAQQDVAALYRRFQASLSPAVTVETRPHQGRDLLPAGRGAHAARRRLHRRRDATQRVGGGGDRRRHRARTRRRGARREPPRRVARARPPRRVPAGEHEDAEQPDAGRERPRRAGRARASASSPPSARSRSTRPAGAPASSTPATRCRCCWAPRSSRSSTPRG